MKGYRSIVVLVAALLSASVAVGLQPGAGNATVSASQTVVSIQGTRFLIDGRLTSPGKPAEGQLLNTRMAQAIFDDDNPATVGDWAYPTRINGTRSGTRTSSWRCYPPTRNTGSG